MTKKISKLMDLVYKFNKTLKTLLRVGRSVLLPYKASKEELDFVEENAKHWPRAAEKKASYGVVLVETALSTPSSLLEKFLIAKKIEQKTSAQVIGILNAMYPAASSGHLVAQSFGVSRFICFWRGYLNPLLITRVFTKTLSLILYKRSGKELLDLQIDGVHIGDLIYDTLIRYRPKSYTVGNLSFKAHFRLIFRAIFNFYSTQEIFRRLRVKAFVTSHNVYAEFGIPCRIAHKHRAAIFLKDMDVFRVYSPEDNVYEHFLRISSEELCEASVDQCIHVKVEEYFERRMNGGIDQIDLNNAYGNKRTYSKWELLEMFGADPSKKTVFVLAHAFSDAPHVGGELAFDDYYDWLRQTLNHLSGNQEVNIIVKPHPSSYMWGEKGAVEVLLEDLGTTNIHITPSDFNTLSIKSIADYVITARGTAGLEYSGFGIPAITCGKGYYSGFSIAIEKTEREAYLEALDNITTLMPLPDEITFRARLVLYLTFTKLARSTIAPKRHIYPGDDMSIFVPMHFNEMCINLKKIGIPYDKFCEKVERAVESAF